MKDHISEYAKAYAGAAAVIITFLVGEVGLDLPETVTSAIALLLVPVVVALVPNKTEEHPPQEVPGREFGGTD